MNNQYEQQQQQQHQQQPERLMHPTSYHLQQMQSSVGRDVTIEDHSSMAYSPYSTPHSLTWNPKLTDPQLVHYQQVGSPTSQFSQQHSPTSLRLSLTQQTRHHIFPPVKEEPGILPDNSYDAQGDIDYTSDPSGLSALLSPLSKSSSLDSPMGTKEDDITTSVESPYHISPSEQDLYSPGPDQTKFFFDSNDIPTSPENQPLNLSSPMAVNIPRTGTSSINIVRSNQHHHHNGHYNTLHKYNMNDINTFQSMSMPVHGVDWFGAHATSLGGESVLGSTALNYSHNGPLSATAADMSLMAGIFDSDEGDTTIGTGTPVLGDLSVGRSSKLGHSLPAGSSVNMLYEKRRRRRESHNAVERRRRDNINEKIQELSTLLPDCLIDSTSKLNKGVILRKSVDYIRQLQQLVQQQGRQNQELEHIINKTGLANQTTNLHNGNGSSVPRGGISAAFQTQNQNKVVGGIGMAFGQTSNSEIDANESLTPSF